MRTLLELLLGPKSHSVKSQEICLDCHSTFTSESEIRDAALTQASNHPSFEWDEVKNGNYQTSFLTLFC